MLHFQRLRQEVVEGSCYSTAYSLFVLSLQANNSAFAVTKYHTLLAACATHGSCVTLYNHACVGAFADLSFTFVCKAKFKLYGLVLLYIGAEKLCYAKRKYCSNK